MKGGVLFAVVLGLLVLAPAAVAARALEAPAHGPGLLELPRYEHALIELERGSLAGEGGELISRRLNVWRLPTATALRVLPRLLDAGVVRLVEPDRPLEYAAVSADPFSGLEWWRPVIGADQVAPPGPGKPLTVIDSGIDPRHAEFRGRPNTILLNPQNPLDEGHGTAVASVASAPENGVGIVGVYPQVVLRSYDAGPPTVGDVIRGLELASDERNPGVINLSLGFPDRDPILERQVLVAFGTGSIVVAAAGNDRAQGSPQHFPANLNHVLTIAATDQSGNVSAFSTASLGVDLAAPGVAIPAAFPGESYIFATGTSFSAPIVSAATAWVWTVRANLDNTQVFDLMRYSARDIGPQGFDNDTGFGIVNIPNALSQAPPATDHQEPNDDVEHVRARGLFRQATAPLTTPARGRASLRARLDATEDPEDVYRVWVPAGRIVRVTVSTDTDVDVDFWNATTRTVLARGAERRRHLLGSSAKRGRAVERIVVRNRGRRGFYGYLDVFLRANGPGDAEYTLTLSTARR